MRIERLDLLRYGRFTDTSLDFPTGTPDVHIVFGPNEAGKSTSLAATEDLLFGIPHNSPYNFLHDYASMRVGGVLQHGQQFVYGRLPQVVDSTVNVRQPEERLRSYIRLLFGHALPEPLWNPHVEDLSLQRL